MSTRKVQSVPESSQPSFAPVVEVELGGATYRLGRLNLSQLKQFRQIIFARTQDIPNRDPVQFTFDVVPVIGASLRAVPGQEDITDEQVELWLDLSNVFSTFHRVFDANGLQLVPAGDAGDGDSAGEAPAPAA